MRSCLRGATDQMVATLADENAPVERIEEVHAFLLKLRKALPWVHDEMDELCGVVEQLIGDLRGTPAPPI